MFFNNSRNLMTHHILIKYFKYNYFHFYLHFSLYYNHITSLNTHVK